MKTNEVPTSWNINVRSYNKILRETSYSNIKRNKWGDRNITSTHVSKLDAKKIILPTLNIKHHPKSIQSIQNKI